jgi:hypothetical protein
VFDKHSFPFTFNSPMKKIITLPPPIDSISIQDLPAYPIIGASQKNKPNEKMILVMTEYENSNSYVLLAKEAFEQGNRFDKPYKDTIEKILKHPTLDFFLFDSSTDLFKWLSE